MTTTTTAAVTAASAAKTAEREFERESLMLKRRIGSTEYLIAVRYSQTGKETLEDKILKLIESEVTRIA
ncbi:hypothetical protein FACS1894219_06200 [Clostridia bacterium]|nr:hypothetical protein FACS1894219_06200 [Clostridia bacterium]